MCKPKQITVKLTMQEIIDITQCLAMSATIIRTGLTLIDKKSEFQRSIVRLRDKMTELQRSEIK